MMHVREVNESMRWLASIEPDPPNPYPGRLKPFRLRDRQKGTAKRRRQQKAASAKPARSYTWLFIFGQHARNISYSHLLARKLTFTSGTFSLLPCLTK